MTNRRRQSEQGFMLLLVFAMAAAVACLIYLEMPRIAFESQRNKEELLVDRGEQFIRAIRIFRQEVPGKMPQTLDELERFNNRRFLRRRYKDPMTGTDDWRLIHSDANGVLADSLIQSVKDKDKQQADTSVLAAKIQGVGETATASGGDTQGSNNPGLQRRASDRLLPGSAPSAPPTDPNDPNAAQQNPALPLPAGVPVPPGLPGAQPGQPAQPGAVPGQPGIPQPGGQPPQQGQQQNQSAFGSSPAFGGSAAFGSATPAQPNQPGGPTQNPYQNQLPFGQPGMGGTPSPSQPGQPGQPSNQAVDLIRNALMNPRPGGPPAGVGPTNSGTLFGAGIAGVASKKDLDSIKVYKDQTNYKLWEFVFDPRAEQQKAQQQQQQQMQQGQQGQPGPGTNPTNPGTQQNQN